MATTKSDANRPWLWLVAVIVILLGIGLWIWNGIGRYVPGATPNHSQEVVKTLEDALVKAGASRTSGSGDAGRGLDNTEPWYDATYVVKGGQEQAITLANNVASNNGFTLTHASPTNRGPLGAVADAYIDRWYFDTSSKKSSYSDLQDGPVRLEVEIDKSTKDANQSTIRLIVRLPNTR